MRTIVFIPCIKHYAKHSHLVTTFLPHCPKLRTVQCTTILMKQCVFATNLLTLQLNVLIQWNTISYLLVVLSTWVKMFIRMDVSNVKYCYLYHSQFIFFLTFRLLSAIFFIRLPLNGDTLVILCRRRYLRVDIGLHLDSCYLCVFFSISLRWCLLFYSLQMWLQCRHLAVVVWRRFLIAVETCREEKGKLTVK